MVNYGTCFVPLHSFLYRCYQFVVFQETIFSMLPNEIGVAQGSILAPTLFLLHIHDLLTLPLYSQPFAHADDTIFMTRHKIWLAYKAFVTMVWLWLQVGMLITKWLSICKNRTIFCITLQTMQVFCPNTMGRLSNREKSYTRFAGQWQINMITLNILRNWPKALIFSIFLSSRAACIFY